MTLGDAEQLSWILRLKRGLGRSTTKLSEGVENIFFKRHLDQKTLEELEDLLIGSDLGPSLAKNLTSELARTRLDKSISPQEVLGLLARDIGLILKDVAIPLECGQSCKPHVALVVGVNGTGKTTTIGKLASRLVRQGKKTYLAAGDTFRAAAIEQLKIWSQRSGADIITPQTGTDPSGLAYDALRKAQLENADILLIDTAGRLQNKADLMAELSKIVRVLRKLDPDAPHSVLLVLDATTGQNALRQVEVFSKICDVTGLIMTKLDGTAKGGVLVSVAQKFNLPIHAIGIGEQIEDLQPFEAQSFARALIGLD